MRSADPRHDVTDVGLHRLPVVVSHGTGTHGVALKARQLLRETLVLGPTRGEDLDTAPSFLRVRADLLENRVDLFHRHPCGMGVCGGRREENEGSASLGIRDGEQHGDEGSVVEPDHGGLVRTRRVEHRDGVLHLRLEVREPIEGDGVRQAGASPIEVDQASERA